MGEQVGIQSAFQLGIHNHLNNTQGGVLHAYAGHQGYRRPYRTGALAVTCANDAERSLTGVGMYTLMKRTLINTAQPGVYRIYWEMRNDDNFSNVATKFYVNGVAVSAAQTRNLNTYAPKTYNYDVSLAAGDLLDIWGDPLGDTVWVRNFRIMYDWRIEYFGDGTSHVLLAPLPLADLDLLNFTAVV